MFRFISRVSSTPPCPLKIFLDKNVALQICTLVHFEKQQNIITFMFQLSQNDLHILDRAKAQCCSKLCNDCPCTVQREDRRRKKPVSLEKEGKQGGGERK